jgi:hypothetical protein
MSPSGDNVLAGFRQDRHSVASQIERGVGNHPVAFVAYRAARRWPSASSWPWCAEAGTSAKSAFIGPPQLAPFASDEWSEKTRQVRFTVSEFDPAKLLAAAVVDQARKHRKTLTGRVATGGCGEANAG